MKTIRLTILTAISFLLMAVQCSEVEPINEPCRCEIVGIVQISFNNGETWNYNATDGRTGMLFNCEMDSTFTNQETKPNGVKYRTYWKCKK